MDQAATVVARRDEEFDPTLLSMDGDTNPEKVAAEIAAAMTGASTDEDDKAKEQAAAEAAAKAEAETAEQAAAAKTETAEAPKGEASATQTDRADGVLLKDGKNVAPYAVLEDARRRATEERQAREEAEARAKALEEELQKLQSGTKTDTTTADALNAEVVAQIEDLKERVPEVGGVMEALMTKVKDLSEQLAAVKVGDDRRQQQEQAQRQASVEEQVQAAIDANPKLVYAQQKDQALWNRIAAQDEILRTDPAMEGMSYENRFALAVKAVEALHGQINLPPEFLPKSPATTTPAGLKSEDAKAIAEAKLREADRGAAPLTLSDLPGGVPPSTNDNSLAAKSPADIDRMVTAMLEKGLSPQELAGALLIEV